MRVLVVDDNEDLVESMAMVLQLLGHDVTVAGNGSRALEQMEARAPDVVLLDVDMPGMNGYEVVSRARQQTGRAMPVLVAMTGWGRDEDKARALGAGFDRHVTKPLDLEGLKSLLSSLEPDSRLG